MENWVIFKKSRMIGTLVFFLLFSTIASSLLTTPTLVKAATPSGAACKTDSNFLGFPYWYRGLTDGADCNISVPADDTELSKFIWSIVINITEIVLRLIAVTATGYIIYGGFVYLTSNGSPEKATKGLTLITNASIGLILAISSVAVINTAFSIITGPEDPSGGYYKNNVTQVLTAVTSIVYWIAGAVAVTMFILAGIRFISSSGNPDRIQKARKSMTNSAIGLIVIILAFSITSIIMGFFK